MPKQKKEKWQRPMLIILERMNSIEGNVLNMCKVCPIEGEVGADNQFNTCAGMDPYPCAPCYDWLGS